MPRSHRNWRRRGGSSEGTTPPFAKNRANGTPPNLGGEFMSRFLLLLSLILGPALIGSAHDIITTPVTWNREISRIFYSRCVACHHEGGIAFSVTEYSQTFPWRTAI